jgi:putative ABC transport system permease protein
MHSVRSLILNDAVEGDLDAELRAWVDELVGRYEAEGLSPSEARRRALLDTEGFQRVKDVVREQRAPLRYGAVGQDIRYALRTLTRQRGFSAIVVAMLALGTGASTAVFSVLDVLFLRPPNFRNVDRLVHIFDMNSKNVEPGIDVDPSPGNFLDWRAQLHSFQSMAAWRNWYFTFAGGRGPTDAPQSIRGVQVSPTFFDMLGVSMQMGRSFSPDEERSGQDHVVILTHRLWTMRFNADPRAIGQTVYIDGTPRTVVGILPATFQFLQPDLDIWMPLVIDSGFASRSNHSVMVFAQLGTDTSLAQAQGELDALCAALARLHPDTNAAWGARLVPLHPNHYLGYLRPGLAFLLAASGLVLLIACANVVNLLLARSLNRRREFAIRSAVGASRCRLISQAIVESTLLSSLGALAGWGVAVLALRVLFPLLPHPGTNETVASYGPIGSVNVDVRIFIVVVLFAVLVGVACGLLPALMLSKDDDLRASIAPRRSGSTARVLIAVEVALSVVLLFSATVLLKSLWQLERIHTGFNPKNVITMQVWLPNDEYRSPLAISVFFLRTLQAIEHLPGVQAAGAVNFRPFLGLGSRTKTEIPGWVSPDAREPDPVIPYRVISASYVRALGQSLLSGRDFAQSDAADAEGVALVNKAMAEKFWPGRNPIGMRIRPQFRHTDIPWNLDAEPRSLTVVGVVSNIKEFRVTDPEYPEFYVSNLQFPSPFMFLVVRANKAGESLERSVQAAIGSVDPRQSIGVAQTMEDGISASLGQPRFSVALLLAFALIALLLAASGVYALTTYAVAQRSREIAIRMALGSSASAMWRMCVGGMCVASGIGAGAGAVAGVGANRVIAGLSYGVPSVDLGGLIIAVVTLLVVATVAAAIPMRRLSYLDPLAILRAD